VKLATILQYISEAMPSPPKNVDPDAFNTFTKEVNLELAAKLIQEKCSDSIDSPPLFRGMGTRTNVPYFAADSSQIPRQSKDNANHYTELMSTGLESWRGWPRRDRATLCSNDIDLASVYGTVYRVYPENGTTLAIAPSYDIWASFPKMIALMLPSVVRERSYFGLDDLVKYIADTGEQRGAKTFSEALQLPAKVMFPKATVAAGGTVLSFLEQYMSPEFNGFKRGVVGRVPIPSRTNSTEIWFSGRAVFVHNDEVDELETLL
jgi:hypothetical protein